MRDIYNYVIEQRGAYEKPVNIIDGWDWSMKEHLRLSFLYKNSQFDRDNENRDKRPFKNIVKPILNIHYRTEGFDVKDIEIYVDNPENYYKSFLVKKFHDMWALKHSIDTFIDEVVESFVDYGGVLVKNVDDVKPEVVDLQTIAFCDQTDLLSGPFGIRHQFSPDQLRAMSEFGWGDESKGATIDIETLITLSESQKESDSTKNATPGKYIEIFEVHGTFPEHYLGKDSDKYTSQIHIVAFYKDDQDNDIGTTLFAMSEPELPFKFLSRDGGITGRALGPGAVEELFDPQVWVNSSEVIQYDMLEQASKILYKSTDPRIAGRNSLRDVESGQIIDLQEGRDLQQIDNSPRNIQIFEQKVQEWETHAQRLGGASEALQGDNPASGTPFKLQEAIINQAESLHRWRQGQLAVFIDEIYRDWIIPHIKSEINKGQKFLSELSADELSQVVSAVTRKKVNGMIKDALFNGVIPTPEEIDLFRQRVGEKFLEKGSKRFLELVKGELKQDSLDVRTNIAGKQKNLALLTDKIVNLVRQFISTPQIRQDPEMVKLLNSILESSGLSPIMYGSVAPPPQQQAQGGSTEGLKDLAKTEDNA